MTKHSVSGDADWVPPVVEPPRDRPGVHTIATCDHADITRWAAQHNAQPATGEAIASGPAVQDVNEMEVGIRFNFPGFAPFRPILWEEWFENFDRYGLTFVYEEEVADRAYEFYQRRGGEHGRDQDDWFEAERQMHKPGSLSARYRLIKE